MFLIGPSLFLFFSIGGSIIDITINIAGIDKMVST